MALLQIAEVFGHRVDDHTDIAKQDRAAKRCPFKNARCTKGGTSNPLAVCSMTDGQSLATLCPVRFLQEGRIFTDVGRAAFGADQQIIAAPEVHILRVDNARTTKSHRVGKVDFLISKLDVQGNAVDFAALEVQSVYFSGGSIRPGFKRFIQSGTMPDGYARRPDWRSSAQKRLMPQLELKVPVFRRWGKKFFVAVDSMFFDALPKMTRTKGLANSEVTWLVYNFGVETGFAIAPPQIVYTTWPDVEQALREGSPPLPEEVLSEVQRKFREKNLPVFQT